MIRIPRYEEYSLVDLYHVLNTIKGDLYPHVLEALEAELLSREPRSVVELEDCYFVLDKRKNPVHAQRLLGEIERRGGFVLSKPFEITEQNKYQTFWPRFWALFLDGFVVGIPLALVLFAIQGAEALRPAAEAYVDQISQFVGIAYFVLMHAKYGQTVGKMATKVKIWDKTEAKEITFRQSLMREIVPAIFAFIGLVYFLGFGVADESGGLTETAVLVLISTAIISIAWSIVEIVTMLFSTKRRALHDLIAGTVVTRIP